MSMRAGHEFTQQKELLFALMSSLPLILARPPSFQESEVDMIPRRRPPKALMALWENECTEAGRPSRLLSPRQAPRGGTPRLLEVCKQNSKEELKEAPIEEEVVMKAAKPLARVQTALNLSESIEIAEGNNGPILVHEEEDSENTSDGRIEEMKNQQQPQQVEEKEIDYATKPTSPEQKWNTLQNGSHNGLTAEIPKEPEAKPLELWKLPMSQWPKPKSSHKPEPAPSEPQAIKEPKEIPLIKQKPKQKVEFVKKPAESSRKPSDASIDEPVMKPIQKHRWELNAYNFITEFQGVPKNGPMFKFVTGYAMRPKDGEEGEDAYFVSERGLGVADGVSGWSAYGINASAFSQKLMEECENELRKVTGLQKEEIVEVKKSRIPKTASYVALDFHANTVYGLKESDEEDNGPGSECSSPKINRRMYEVPINSMQILSNSYEKVAEIGSSTATVVVLNGNEIEAVNLGDSGFIHLTQKAGEYYINGVSKEQQHEFNVPFQLSRLPPAEYLSEMEYEGRIREVRQLKRMLETNKMCKDNPEDADQYNQEVQDSDIFVLGTDGVFDNLFSYEIKNIIRECMRSVSRINSRVAKVNFGFKQHSQKQEIAEKLVGAAYRKSKMPVVDTPFKRKFKKVENKAWTSGKEDDITVAVGIVKPYNYYQYLTSLQFIVHKNTAVVNLEINMSLQISITGDHYKPSEGKNRLVKLKDQLTSSFIKLEWSKKKARLLVRWSGSTANFRSWMIPQEQLPNCSHILHFQEYPRGSACLLSGAVLFSLLLHRNLVKIRN
eukprot:TRINITY_DN2806_c0_g1_i1.p1 TRINITY_DN2806_c0_g1~~TRINITY_DN2806_c0_g1_i1.p1  ORF type:complete len:780 (+),score=74.10 TRINITY_DN2806_c0_g1_i1:395-2734(+)